MGKRRDEERRIEASHAAAVAFSGGDYVNVEELWSLCIFFERFIKDGGDGTLRDFGPRQETAQILTIVK